MSQNNRPDSSIAELKKRIQELEKDLASRQAEEGLTKKRLLELSSKIEKLIEFTTDEIQWAQKIQKTLSPTEFPHIQGFAMSSKFIPGLQHGGDYFDIFEMEDHLNFGVILSSSSGYGMSSLFLGVFLKMISTPDLRQGKSIDAILRKITQQLRGEMKDIDQMSLFLGLIDRRRLEMTYAQIGELGVCHQIYERGEVKTLVATAPTFSKKSSDQFESGQITFNPKDRLVLVSPGVVDARNAGGKSWGVSRLNEVLRHSLDANVHDIRNEILLQVEQFSSLSEPIKDQTVLVLEIKDRALKLAADRD